MAKKFRKELLKNDLEELSFESKIALYCIKNRQGIKRTRLQKLTFLIDRILRFEEVKRISDVEPYYYGPFSEGLAEQLQGMTDEGILVERNGGYHLTDYGNELTNLIIDDFAHISNLIGAMNNISDRELVKIVYELFPEFTEKSLIKDKLPEFRQLHIRRFDFDKIPKDGMKIDIGGKPIKIIAFQG